MIQLMNISTKKCLLLAGIVGLSGMSLQAAVREGRADLSAFSYKRAQRNVLANVKDPSALIPGSSRAKTVRQNEGYEPSVTFGPASYTGDLDGPDGELWYYTADLDYEVLPMDPDNGIYFRQKILRAYSYSIYDPDFNLVGEIKSDMIYEDDETNVVGIELAPVISRNFFNTDDKLEVMVALSINTGVAGVNHYRTLVYTLGGEKTPEGNDKVLTVVPDLLGDVVEGPRKADGSDNFYMTFISDYYPSDEDIEGDDVTFWDYLTSARLDMTVYASAVDDKGHRAIAERSIPLINLPGDQEGSPFLMSIRRDDDVYFVFESLEHPLWNEYNDPIMDEMTQRESNKLRVELFKAGLENLDYLYTTEIDVMKDPDDEMAIASFFSVGDMRYKEDIIFDAPGAPEGKAWIVVCKENYNPASDNSSMSYYLYDHEGNLVHKLAEYCDSAISLSDIEGQEPQQIFITNGAYGYGLSFVDILSGKENFWTSSLFDVSEDADPEFIMANIDRVPSGDSYKYAVELSYPAEENGNTYMRVMWLDSKGRFERIDMVNAGENVLYGQFYIARDALHTDVFHSDEEQEYLILVKRGVPGAVLTEELMVVQPRSERNPEGNTLLTVEPGEKGQLTSIIPDLGGDEGRLVVYYGTENEDGLSFYTQDIYRLPLDSDNTGVGNITVEGAQDVLKVNGSLIESEGEISVYTASGSLVARALGSIDLGILGRGLYIAVSDGASVKVLVR